MSPSWVAIAIAIAGVDPDPTLEVKIGSGSDREENPDPDLDPTLENNPNTDPTWNLKIILLQKKVYIIEILIFIV